MSKPVGGEPKLAGRVAVITGGTRGFGLAIARAFVREGAAVVVASRSVESVDRAVARLRSAGGRAEGLAADVSDYAQVERIAERALDSFGRLDVWVNNAGHSPAYGPSAHIAPEEFLDATRTIVEGTYNGSHVALRHFLPRKSGKLINVLGRGDDGPVPLQNAYASGKAWARSFTLALAQEYKASGVGIYAINPGMMRTDLLTKLRVVAGSEDRLRVMPTIIGMWASPPEVPAERVVWLASAESDGKTGLHVREMSGPKMLVGAAREGMRRLLRLGPSAKVDLTVVPAALAPIPHPRPAAEPKGEADGRPAERTAEATDS